jgi:flagellar assembly protein FliH
MGRIIKKEEQTDVSSAPLDETLHDKDVPGSSLSRIPKERVNPPQESDQSPDQPVARGPVLEAGQVHRTSGAVQIEPIAPEPTSSQSASAERTDEAADDESGTTDDVPGAADDTPERTDAEWQEHLEAAVEEARTEGYKKGYSEGYDDGYDEAETTLREDWEAEREALIDDTNRFEEVWSQYIAENESRMVELTLQLAEAIVDAPLTDSLRSASEEAILEAVAELAGTPPIEIVVHPVDYQRLQESGLAAHLTDKYDELHLESDPERTEGDWTVASPAGAIRRRRSEVIDALRGRLGLASSGGASSGGASSGGT